MTIPAVDRGLVQTVKVKVVCLSPLEKAQGKPRAVRLDRHDRERREVEVEKGKKGGGGGRDSPRVSECVDVNCERSVYKFNHKEFYKDSTMKGKLRVGWRERENVLSHA